MKKLLIILGSIIGGLLILLILAMIGLTIFFDPNAYKDEIAAAAKNATGRELTMQGDISLTFFPWLGAEMGPLSLTNAQGFTHEDMVQVGKVRVSVKLLPLIQKRVVMDNVFLKDMVVHLEKNEQGTSNWDDLIRSTEDAGTAEPAPEEPPGRGSPLKDLTIDGLTVENTKVTWDDRQADQSLVLSNLHLDTGAIELGQFFDLELAFDLDLNQPAVTTNTLVTGSVMADLDNKRYEIEGLELRTQAEGEAVPGKSVTVNLRSDISADLNQEIARISDLVLETLNLKVSGNIEAREILKGPAYTGSVNIAEFNPKELMLLLNMAPPETSDEDSLKSMSADLAFAGTTESADLESLKATLDETSITGTATISSFKNPSYAFSFDVDRIDADRYLPPPGQEEAEPVQEEKKEADEKADPLEPLRDLNLKGDILVGWLKVMNVKAEDIKVTMEAKNGLLRVDPLLASLYGGSTRGALVLNARQQTPTWSVNEKVTAVQAGPLLKDLLDKDMLTGTTQLNLDLSGSGLEPERIKRTLDGTVDFDFENGAVKGINIAKMLRDARAMIMPGMSPTGDDVRQTDFSTLSGTAVITNGLVTNDDLLMKSPLLRVSGEGKVDLPENSVDYTVIASVVGTLEGQGGAELTELRDIPVPIRISGDFADLSFKPDLRTLTKRLGQEKGVEEAKKRIEEEVGGRLQKVLPLGRDSSTNATDGETEDKDSGLPLDIPGLFKKN